MATSSGTFKDLISQQIISWYSTVSVQGVAPLHEEPLFIQFFQHCSCVLALFTNDHVYLTTGSESSTFTEIELYSGKKEEDLILCRSGCGAYSPLNCFHFTRSCAVVSSEPHVMPASIFYWIPPGVLWFASLPFCLKVPLSVLQNTALYQIGHLPCSTSASTVRFDGIGSVQALWISCDRPHQTASDVIIAHLHALHAERDIVMTNSSVRLSVSLTVSK